jgi:bacillithiol biosynthesis cysteine-adding enzyme BshC
MDWIDFRELPAASGGFTRLFLDYLQNAPALGEFFAGHFRDPRSYATVMENISRRQPDRSALVAVLEEQNAGADAATIENIEALRSGSTFAVVTGQQVGLFGGPLYTILKSITTVKLAAALKEQHPGVDVVPVFWVEGEDHDFAEVHGANVLNTEGVVSRVEYLPEGGMPERNPGAVGEIAFEPTLETTYTALAQALQQTEFTPGVLAGLRNHYRPGATFASAFVGLLRELLAGSGLVFLYPNDPRIKRLLSPLFRKEVETFPHSSRLVITQSAALEHDYHAQIKAKSLNLFLFHKGGRYLIEPRESDFSLKGTRHFLPPEELRRIAVESPELLSTNVVLRPVAQDTVLPTVAYVGGPSEVAYHAQLGPVYEFFGVTRPVIHPRASVSFVEQRLQRAMEKYELHLPEFFGDVNRISARVLESIAEVKLDALFGGTQQQVHAAMEELKFGLREVDPTLLGTYENTVQKIDTSLTVLREKAVAAQKRRNEVAIRQIEKAVNGLLPNGGLQERELNVVYFLNKYGPGFLTRLLRELVITEVRHQIIVP